MEKFEVTTVVPISEKRLMDLMCAAWEGGSNYWASCVAHNREQVGCQWVFEVPFHPEGEVTIQDIEDGDTFVLNLQKIQAGLQAFAKQYPRHFMNFLDENEDAETGDVFLQCCVFGRVELG
jgi:hypothetical protein